MPTFRYEARGPTGSLERGRLQADNARAAARQLQAKGYIVTRVRAERPAAGEGPLAAAVRTALAPVFFPVSSKALGSYFSSLAALLQAGMSIVEAMETLANQTGNPILRRAAREMGESAAAGRPMSSVMRRYPAAFHQATMAAIEAGEESGLLERTAGRLARYYDRAFELEQIYRWHTFYPKVLLIALLLIPTVPTLVLEGFHPWLHLALGRGLPVLAAIVVLWYGWRALRRVPQFGRAVDAVKLFIPWFGSLGRRMATARWARALAMLLEAGVPVHRSLVAAAAATGNRAMEEALVREARGVLEGRSLSETIASSGQLPRMALDLLATAERSGSFEEALERVAQYYESEADVGGKQTAVAIGVLAYLIVAGIIAVIVISFWGGHVAGLGALME